MKKKKENILIKKTTIAEQREYIHILSEQIKEQKRNSQNHKLKLELSNKI